MKYITTLLFILSFGAFVGCSTLNPASKPSDDKTPLVLNETSAKVLMAHSDRGDDIMASALESIQSSGNVIFIDHEGYLFDGDNKPVIVQGQPVKIKTKVIAKLNSLPNIESLKATKFEYEVGGYSHLRHVPDTQKALTHLAPTALFVNVEGIDASARAAEAEIKAASAKEREAIFAGMAALAQARGAAFATKVEALSDGITKVTTVAGREILGQVTGTKTIEAAVEGVDKVKEIVIKPNDGGPEEAFVLPVQD